MYDSVNGTYITILTSVVWIATMLALVAYLAYHSYSQDYRPFAEKASKFPILCFIHKDKLKTVSASIEG